MYKQVNNDRMEFDDSDYEQAVEDRKNLFLMNITMAKISKKIILVMGIKYYIFHNGLDAGKRT